MPAQWIKRYKQASFRNVAFYIKGHSTTGGRRLARQEFPENDVAYIEDLGLREKTFTLDAYIVEEDYFAQRNRLEKALDSEGPGKLVHPYRGNIQVYVEDYNVTETTEEGCVARFSIKFTLAETEELTLETITTEEAVLGKKTSLFEAIHEWCVAAYKTTSLAVNKVNAIVDVLDTAVGVIEDAKLLLQPYAEFQAIISNAKGKLISIALDSEILFATIRDIVDFGTDTAQDINPTSDNALQQYNELIASLGRTKDTDIAQGQQINALQKKITIGSCATLLLSVNFSSADEAREVSDVLFNIIDETIEDQNTSDNEFSALLDLKAILSGNITQRISELSKLKTIVLPETTPSLAIMQNLYGSVEEEQAFITRNKIAHPAFIPGGIELKVVTDV